MSLKANTCPNVVRLESFNEKPWIQDPEYTFKGWTWFEGVCFGDLYTNIFIKENMVKGAGYDSKLENVEVLEALEGQSVYFLNSTEGPVVFGPDLEIIKEFLSTLELKEEISPKETVIQDI